MRDFIAVKSVVRFLAFAVLTISLSACQTPETRQTDETMDVLAEPHVKTDIQGYAVELEIADETYSMEINDYRFLTATIPSIKPGEYTLTRRYYANGVLLGSSTDRVKVLEWGRTLFVPLDTRTLNSNFDDDADGWTNLAEANLHSNYQDPFSMPGGTKPGFAINAGGTAQAHAAQFAVNDYVGTPASSERSKSKTYSMTHYY